MLNRMSRRWTCGLLMGVMAFMVQTSSGQEGVDVLRKAASWNWIDSNFLGEQFRSYLDLVQVDRDKRSQVEQYWREHLPLQPGPSMLDHVLQVASMIDIRIRSYLERIDSLQPDVKALTDFQWFDSKVPGWLQDNLKLAAGRQLAQMRLYDESLQVLSELDRKNVVDPSTLMFYQAICHHHLLQREACLEALDTLLEREEELVTRFAVTARLMKADIDPLEADSLDEIARLMKDVERRLGLGRAGSKVQETEEEIIKKLDKMIDQIEQQLQQQQQMAQQSQRNSQSQGKPLDQSAPLGGSGPGDVAPKDIGNQSGWGNLPPAQRQEALQNITKDLPSHYREVIEAYFRRLGKGE